MKRRGLDPKNLKIIEEEEVPAKPQRYTPYREVLGRIRKGKALVISDEEISVDTARAAIRRLQRKGEFKKLVLSQVKGQDGIKKLYVVNPSEEEK
jgi:hypothetical protein